MLPAKIRQIKPTLDTLWHIDYKWWEKEGRDLRVYLRSHLCPEHQAIFQSHLNLQQMDWVDPDTGEVRRVDGFQHTLRTHCSQQPDYITSYTPLVDAIFRIFLANGNAPLSARELADRLGRNPETILQTLAGARIYKGLRPVEESRS
ncbi:MAG: hypothetical protein C4310_02195 [Chloroflexota bacterium]